MEKDLPEPKREPGVEAPYSTAAVRDAKCATRTYYREIKREMQALEKPTIGDAIKAMCRKGNKPFFEHDWLVKTVGLSKREVQESGFEERDDCHELLHFISGYAHTPEQENMMYPMDMGIRLGVGIAHPDLREGYLEHKKNGLRKAAEYREQNGLLPVVPANDRNWAINFATGLYMNAKIKAYREDADIFKTYEEKLQFCRLYSQFDHPIFERRGYEHFDSSIKDLLDLPYDFLEISKEEKDAITAVALQLKKPQDTPYPYRMQAIYEALVNTQELHDGKSWIERMQEKHGFDPDKCKEAREKQHYR